MRKKKEEEFKVEVTYVPEIKPLKKKAYIGYPTRIAINVLLLIATIAMWSLCLYEAIDYRSEKTITYTEKSNLDYRVYLKPNHTYDQPYLDKNMLYIASLIDNINIDFTYDFSIAEQSNIDFTYSIYGKLIIADESGQNTYFEKEYNLLEEQNVDLLNGKEKRISENISVNYDYYNDLANDFKMSYGVDTESYLKVSLKINKKSEEESDFSLNDSDELSLTIPLSEKSLDIKMDYNEINETNSIIAKSHVSIRDMKWIITAAIFFLLSIIYIIKLARLLSLLGTKKSNYDKYINRILVEYDRLVVETLSCPDLAEYNVVKIKRFEELLDVRDNLKLPIMYYNLIKHQKSYFYVKHGEDIYLLTVKAVDMEK